jgi:hypothetical protein
MMANPSPQAVVALSRYLAQSSPGVHDAAIRAAAELSLLSIPALNEAPGELFQLLGEFGNAGTVNVMVDLPWHLDAYASVALALIPDGSGLDLIIQDARLYERGYHSTHGRLAIELLAQRACENPGAAQALFDLARQGLIPTDAWPNVLAAIAGEQSISLVRPAFGLRSTHTIFRPNGNQVIYWVTNMTPSTDTDGYEDIRLALLDELLRLAPMQEEEPGSKSGS